MVPLLFQQISSTFPAEGTSPPEAAIEATPETTPIKDPRSRAPPLASSVARALTGLNTPRWPLPSGQSTPSSQPSSPMRKEGSPFRWEGGATGGGGAGGAPGGPKEWEKKGVGNKIARLIEDR